MRTTSFVPTARMVRDTGFWLTSVAVSVAFVVVAADTLRDPGGTEPLIAVGTWVLPMVLLLGLALLWREAATALLLPALVVPVGLALWQALDLAGWEQVRSEVGPFDALTVMFLGFALAFLGRNAEETHLAGLAMIAVALVPPALVLLVAGEVPMVSTALVALPVLVTGLLYVRAAALQHREDRLFRDEKLRDLLPVI